MRIGTLVLRKEKDKNCPTNCINADGSWLTKDKYPDLYEIFKECKCLMPKACDITGIINREACVKGIFHLPDSKGKAWIVCREGLK